MQRRAAARAALVDDDRSLVTWPPYDEPSSAPVRRAQTYTVSSRRRRRTRRAAQLSRTLQSARAIALCTNRCCRCAVDVGLCPTAATGAHGAWFMMRWLQGWVGLSARVVALDLHVAALAMVFYKAIFGRGAGMQLLAWTVRRRPLEGRGFDACDRASPAVLLRNRA